ncbi:hypothetical protein, partial [Mesorhizobium sp.]|uniref:hypothetical protein n=1 Tax=Mesorhizobium sp. TaxID=1871066 RepID=UPI0025D78FEE
MTFINARAARAGMAGHAGRCIEQWAEAHPRREIGLERLFSARRKIGVGGSALRLLRRCRRAVLIEGPNLDERPFVARKSRNLAANRYPDMLCVRRRRDRAKAIGSQGAEPWNLDRRACEKLAVLAQP